MEIAVQEIPNGNYMVIEGGDTRSRSVQNALKVLKGQNSKGVVAIHDGVRPLVSKDLINKAISVAKSSGSAIPVVNPVETVRIGPMDKTSIHDRDEVFLVQTPQCFDLEKLYRAFENQSVEDFTDDAGIYEAEYSEIKLLEGEPDNIKITYPRDLKVLEVLLDS